MEITSELLNVTLDVSSFDIPDNHADVNLKCQEIIKDVKLRNIPEFLKIDIILQRDSGNFKPLSS